jgi:hypothetical protein
MFSFHSNTTRIASRRMSARCHWTTSHALRAASLSHVLPPAPLAHLEICARPSFSRCKGRAEKSCAVMKTERALPDDGRRAQNEQGGSLSCQLTR